MAMDVDTGLSNRKIDRYMKIIVGKRVPVRFYDERRIDEFMKYVKESYRVFGTPTSMVDFDDVKRGILHGGEYVVLDLPGEYHVFLKSGATDFELMHALGHVAQVERLRVVAGTYLVGAVTPVLFSAAGVVNNLINNVIVDYYVYGRIRLVEQWRANAYLEYMREEEERAADRISGILLASGLVDFYHFVSHLGGLHSGKEMTRREREAVARLVQSGTPEAAVSVLDAVTYTLSLVASDRIKVSSYVEPHPARKHVRRYVVRFDVS